MPKLYFRYGTMSSSKTANLLMVAHNYKTQGKKVMLIKPIIDNRFGHSLIKSRCGLQSNADYLLEKDDYNLRMIDGEVIKGLDAILVDEAQFLSEKQVNTLREISYVIPVICYGLRTDYKTNFFEGSKRLMEISDSIEEIKTTCYFCNKKAIINFKHRNGKIIKTGNDDIELGDEDKYLCACYECWFTKSEI
jgi:thymidine kinase